MSAAADMDGMIIGVDIDQSAQSDTVLTSAIKFYGNAARIGLQVWLDEEFDGGTDYRFGLEVDCIGLPMNTSRFETFSQAQYAAILQDIIDGTIVVPRNYDELLDFLNDETLDIPSRETVTGGY